MLVFAANPLLLDARPSPRWPPATAATYNSHITSVRSSRNIIRFPNVLRRATTFQQNQLLTTTTNSSKKNLFNSHQKMESPIEFNNYNMVDEAPMSRTHQYRKVMKPLLERRRRARINKCLDDLKDLMVSALQSEGESITKLEKADVLELTVRHLQKLKRQQMLQANPALDIDRFRAGYSSCASEVSRFLASVPGVKIHLGTQLMSHLGVRMNAFERVAASPISVNCQASPSAVSRPQMSLSPSSDGGYTSGRESSPSPPLSVGCPSPAPQVSSTTVWRPF